MNDRTHTIDAAGKSLGRVASEAAKHLIGKTLSSYTPNKTSGTIVVITNASKLLVSEKKRLTKVYEHYSQYPGGLKREKLSSLSARKGMSAVIRTAVQGMIPRNTLRVGRMKNLTITE
ncbi:50S ribosomal protein L13 [bacterium]|nr:50S ribosomal protein L13 [bacterium]